MASQSRTRLAKLRGFAEFLETLGLFSIAITGPIGAAQGYSGRGRGGILAGLALAIAVSGAMLLIAYLIMRVSSWFDRRA